MSKAQNEEDGKVGSPKKNRKVLGWTLSILVTLGAFYYSQKVSSELINTALEYLLFASAFGVAMIGYNIRK
jgi:hypothetical protein